MAGLLGVAVAANHGGLRVARRRAIRVERAQYSILFRRPEAAVIPYCREHGVSQVVWSPVAQGVLFANYDPGDCARELAREAGCTMAQFALVWVLRVAPAHFARAERIAPETPPYGP